MNTARRGATRQIAFAIVTLSLAASSLADPDISAKAYLDWLGEAIAQQQKQLDAIAESADRAAAKFVANERWSIGALGEHGFAGEANGRAGGIIRISGNRHIRHDRWRGVIMVGLVNHELEGLLKTVKSKREQGCYVVAFGTPAQRAEAREAGVTFDAFIENGASEHDGLFKVDASGGESARWLLPTQHVANMVGLWTWTGEFVGAVTRRGRMTPMYLAYAVPGGREWRKTIGMEKFHGEGLRVEPVESGILGRRFIEALREDLAALRRTELADVRRVAAMALQARAADKKLYAFLHGHAVMGSIGGDHDPGFFTKANRGWVKLAEGVTPDRGDMILCIGFDQLFNDEWFGHFAQTMRSRGVRLAWSVAVNNPRHDYSHPDDEPLIDQGWCFGDASVYLPGYPFKILPTSGVISQSVFWLVQAEMLAMERE